MKTISERRHNDFCAVQRQLKIAVAHGEDAFNSQTARQPHRLHKSSAASVQENDHQSANPRRWAASIKDKLTHAELAHQQGYQLIEVPDLSAFETARRNASRVTVASLYQSGISEFEEIPSSSRLLS